MIVSVEITAETACSGVLTAAHSFCSLLLDILSDGLFVELEL
jgi:hypothetical protein